WLPPS
ncbi:hypothetical protein BN1723_019373, partial [Verticillium longisporum]